MAYASVNDIAERMTRDLSERELAACAVLLDDIAVIIDSVNAAASEEAKKIVSCRAIARMLGSGAEIGIPMGASQGNISALGYAQSWTLGTGGATGEIYLTRLEKQMLGAGNKIGSYSPVEELASAGEV